MVDLDPRLPDRTGGWRSADVFLTARHPHPDQQSPSGTDLRIPDPFPESMTLSTPILASLAAGTLILLASGLVRGDDADATTATAAGGETAMPILSFEVDGSIDPPGRIEAL